MSLDALFAELAATGSSPLRAWPADVVLADYGLRAHGDRVIPAGPFDPLREERIRAAMSTRAIAWLRRLEIFPAIGSTNVELMQRSRGGPVDGTVCSAELQTRGRGRRGRDWSSPFGANLAISLAIALSRPPADLGGASLVVGLAVVDALERLGVSGLALKWPNDVLRGGAKLGGILIEMSRQHGTELIVGAGLNVTLPDSVRGALGQAVADLSDVTRRPSRNVLAGGVISAIVEFLAEFDRLGFAPFASAFDARHAFHGRACQILLGERRVLGRVAGVSPGGELLLDSGAGVQAFNAGEVSLRPRE